MDSNSSFPETSIETAVQCIVSLHHCLGVFERLLICTSEVKRFTFHHAGSLLWHKLLCVKQVWRGPPVFLVHSFGASLPNLSSGNDAVDVSVGNHRQIVKMGMSP